jgi:amino acid permease
MTKANIGLGVLSIPFVFMEVGMVPGVILLLVINLIIMCE